MADAKKPEIFEGFVRARYRGYANGAIREAGEVFEFSGPLGVWMEKVETPAPSDAPKDAGKGGAKAAAGKPTPSPASA